MADELSKYLKSLDRGAKLRYAEACGTKLGYFYQLICGTRQPSLDMARAMQTHSRGKVPITTWMKRRKRA